MRCRRRAITSRRRETAAQPHDVPGAAAIAAVAVAILKGERKVEFKMNGERKEGAEWREIKDEGCGDHVFFLFF
jgi:hypothetical protein